jgi:hypothetical protein
MAFSRDISNYAILYAKTGPGNCGAIFPQRHCGNVKNLGLNMGVVDLCISYV